ncbi:MAG: hypothetical protein H5T69_04445 [Chloroflexi bacterium]|nr:hypothetical protein [Chloroflexota bacterium]
MPQTSLAIENALLAVVMNEADGALVVRDKRTGTLWRQRAIRSAGMVKQAGREGNRLRLLWQPVSPALAVEMTVWLDDDRPELLVTLEAEGQMEAPLAFPHPFVSEAGTYLVVPMNEGISYPVEDASIEPMRLIAYGGHGICMGFWGVTDGEQGYMAIIEDSAPGGEGSTRGTDDAAIRLDRADGLLYISPEWDAQKGRFGYPRALRYVFFDRGGHVAMCKRYRRYVQQQGRFKTLAQKREENPNVDLLIGAANVWCWEAEPLSIVRQMRALGMAHILWSECREARVIQELNALGFLTSTYDIYQDVMDPASYGRIRFIHRRWPEAAWPDDLMLGPDGDWIKGWKIEGKEGGWFPCGVVCDRQAPLYARRRIAEELETLPYTCRFVDTTTATPWRECYHPAHPLTRSESRAYKMELLRLVAEDFHLVTGTETGHDAAVPYVHYFEGMLSLGPYRVPDAGRHMQQIWTEVPERVAKFQLGEKYRLPLWELVYHDCVVAHWYWGDYNNKLPALWDKRDLFNALYGTAPMYMFNRELWMQEQARFVRSYKDTCPLARSVGYAEMLDHRFLTEDRSVQQTTFANGVSVTANFGAAPFATADGNVIGPMSYRVAGLKEG